MASDTTKQDFAAGSATGGTGGATTGRSDPDLEVQISKLREDVAGLSDALKAIASNRADGYRQQAYALRDDVRERGERYVKQAQDAMADLEDQISERVREEPIKSVLIAAAVGYLYARLLR